MRLATQKTSTPLAMLSVLLMTAGLGGFANAATVDVYLEAQSFNKTMPDGADVSMWGYASCPDNTFTGCTVAAPGPQINAAAGDTLNIHIQNTLNLPVSVVIPGQVATSDGAPTMMGTVPDRVRSFTSETAAGAVTTYTWAALDGGTYLYQSGTFPSIEVPMGLYGALVVADAVAGEAYGFAVDAEAVLLLSEIDPIQNARVAAAASGLPGTDCVPLADYEQFLTVGFPCTVDYNPMYFLVNGGATADLPAGGPLDGNPTNTAILRFLNAGLRSHTPSIVGVEFGLIAEDGNAYPGQPRSQSALLLAAGKTLDALIATPDADHTFALFDRMPTFSNENLPNGGSFATLQVGAGSPVIPPPANPATDDEYPVTEDVALTIAAPGVLANDGALSTGTATALSGVAHGKLECAVGVTDTPPICTDGSFTYTPNDDFSGTDSFTYSVSDGTNSAGAQVMLNVSFENDTPVAAADAYTNNTGSTITVEAPGVLGNDADADGDTLYAVFNAGSGVTLNPDGSFTANTSGSFTYTACDAPLVAGACAGAMSDVTTVDLTVRPASNIALIVQEPGGAAVSDYRWTVEEDTTWHPDPGDPDAESLATTFHKSYMPVVAQGCVGATACSIGEDQSSFSDVALDPAKHYYVSVLPADAMDENESGERLGHTVGGTPIPPGASTVTVNVNKEPLPYAQISILIFDDSGPTNGGVDLNERGLGGFQITLEDAGGRYGISAGTMNQDADGNPLTNALDCFDGASPPPGVILSCPDLDPRPGFVSPLAGQVLIKNLFPAKYGVIATAPHDTDWVQTSTIEGTKVIDAWVKAGEPPFFTEFGPVGWHAFVGFASPSSINSRRAAAPNTTTIRGAITNLHMSRPPNQELYDSETYDAIAHSRPWVGLNSVGGRGPNIAAVQATIDDNGGAGPVTATFEIPDVPQDFDYQIVVWDTFLDQVIAYRGVTAADLATNPDVGNIPVFQWYARMENHVFLDENGNGMRETGEGPLTEQAVNLRWRDGSVYQSYPTDREGFVPFDQVFPFFNWLVAEIDYTRFEATGLTVTVDHGGDVSTTGNVLNPQVQADGGLSRTETGQVLTQGFQGFLGQTSVFEWGKRPYEPGANGGIAGIVYYGVTRAESDPRLAAAEPWEPGIARVPVRLYRVVEKADGTSGLALVQETVTDSWDDSLPQGCPGAAAVDSQIVGYDVGQTSGITTKCYDGLRNFNQARPAVFDGGYAFNDIPAGEYVVEVVVPPGYELMKEEDVNVTSGDGYASVFVPAPAGPAVPLILPDYAMVAEAMAPEPGLAQPKCVGELREVPDTLSLFPKRNEEAPFRRAMRPLCDRKLVVLSDQGQAAADFTLLTNAPIAAHFTGMVLDDVAQEFNPLSPQFGEKWAPPFVPISIRDYNGEEISRVYSDQWGHMNGLMPSTFTAYIPSPSGFSPAMHMTCMNDPGPIPDPNNPGAMIVDPQYNPAYSNFCYTFQYMPGTTTYLDTPVLPVSAFASGYNPPDCSMNDATPMIASVGWGNVDNNPGPWIQTRPATANNKSRIVDIRSMGRNVAVPNPAYEGPLANEPKTITRDFSFGPGSAQGTVTLGGAQLQIISWNRNRIRARIVDASVATSGQLVVTRGDNFNSTEYGITVTVSDTPPIRVPQDYPTIQAAIDAAERGDLIVVAPGVYNESVIMWKPVRLQGAGAGSTIINAVKRPTQVLVDWREKMDEIFAMRPREVNALPNQQDGAAGFTASEGAAITVLGRNTINGGRGFLRHESRIDGFSITGGDVGGGVLVNSYAHNLEISNNQVYGNNGSFNGGIRVGQPFLELPAPQNEPGENNSTYELNTGVDIHDNAVTLNGGLGGAGGGISLNAGSDRYTVSENFVCGNFTTGDGGGIGHLGLSDAGRILGNTIVHNQSFNQAVTVSGGGVFIGGEPVIREFLEQDNPDLLSTGSGDVLVRFNRIQGNHAAAGHGGGIRAQFINGKDIGITGDRPKWYSLRILDNVIVNNVSGWSGGGISVHNTIKGVIRRNTIAHNDSTATVGPLIVNNLSDKQPAGISTEPHSQALATAIAMYDGNRPDREFSTPALSGNILWENRSFNYEVVGGTAQLSPVLSQATVGACDPTAVYWDVDARITDWRAGVVGAPGPTSADPGFGASAYCNGGRSLASPPPGPMFALPALDEGGNAWIDVRFGPLTRSWPEGSAPWLYEVTP